MVLFFFLVCNSKLTFKTLIEEKGNGPSSSQTVFAKSVRNTSPQELEALLKGSSCVIICYDVTDAASFVDAKTKVTALYFAMLNNV